MEFDCIHRDEGCRNECDDCVENEVCDNCKNKSDCPNDCGHCPIYNLDYELIF